MVAIALAPLIPLIGRLGIAGTKTFLKSPMGKKILDSLVGGGATAYGLERTGVADKLFNPFMPPDPDAGKPQIETFPELTEAEKEMLVKELEQDVIEMQEITKRWQSDMNSDSWLSKNIRPLSLAFLTVAMFLYVILDSSLNTFNIAEQWVSLLGNLLMLVYGGYFSARTLEKIRKK